jgi:peptide-methionine (S)-S-oxide reductase
MLDRSPSKRHKIGLGGGCHWCTEGVFSSLIGVLQVDQGWMASTLEHASLSEAIQVFFDPSVISLSVLIEIHLLTHSSGSNHSMRSKYRSAIYVYSDEQGRVAQTILDELKAVSDLPIVTEIYDFSEFKLNKAPLQDYFYTGPNRPFCQTYIHPKLRLLLTRFSQQVDHKKLQDTGLTL